MPGVSRAQPMKLMFGTARIILTTATLLWLPFSAAARKQTLEPHEGGIGVAEKPLNEAQRMRVALALFSAEFVCECVCEEKRALRLRP